MTNWGGRRVGAGRKPQGKVSESVTPEVSVPAEPATELEPPADLGPAEQAVWLAQAPHAIKAQTLTAATALAFARYCRVVVLEANEAKSAGMGGPNHRGLLKQVNTYELQFLLAPCGKPLPSQAPSVTDEEHDDEAFFGGPRGIVGGRG